MSGEYQQLFEMLLSDDERLLIDRALGVLLSDYNDVDEKLVAALRSRMGLELMPPLHHAPQVSAAHSGGDSQT